MPGLRDAARPGYGGAAGQPRARVHPAPGLHLQVEGRDQAALAAEFGDEVLALPDDDRFDLAAYLVPALALVVGLGAVGFAALRWRRRQRAAGNEGGTSAIGGTPASKDSERLDSDLERYDL